MQVLWTFLANSGVTAYEVDLVKQLYILLLLLPLVATIIGIARYIIGARSTSLYLPAVVTFLFYEFGTTTGSEQDVIKGLRYGLVLFFIVLFATAGCYYFMRKLRMHFVPKLTIVLIGVCLTIFLITIVSLAFGHNGFIFINQFTFIIVVILTDPLLGMMARKNIRYGFVSALHILVLSIICYLIISISNVQNFLMENPWMVLVFIVINLYIGRFAGLRLSEYFRFKDILFEKRNPTDDRAQGHS